MAILGVFGKLCFFPFLVTKTQMCLTGSITSEKKGGGSDPLRKKSIVNLLFFLDGFPYQEIVEEHVSRELLYMRLYFKGACQKRAPLNEAIL